MSKEHKDSDNESFPEEHNLDEKTLAESVEESDREEDSEVSEDISNANEEKKESQ